MKKILPILTESAKCSLFVLIFLSLVQPFGIDSLREGRIIFILTQTFLSFISIFVSSCIACMLIPIGEQKVTTRKYLFRLLLGNLLNIPLLSTLLISYNSWFAKGNLLDYWFVNGTFTLSPLWVMCVYVSVVSLFVAFFEFYSFRNSKLQIELEEMRTINSLLEKRQEKLQEEENEVPAESVKIVIEGQGQGQVLEVDPEKIIYVESMANYASVCYISNSETRIATLRITLKRLREILQDFDYIVQCHRAFIVNINFVVSIDGKNSVYHLQMFGLDKQIPVSRANTEAIKNRLG